MSFFDRFCGLLSASFICLTLAIASWSEILGPIWRASYSATPDQWLGFVGSLIGALATLLAAGVALFAAYRTLKPMRDQLNQLVRQNDHNLYDGVRRRAAELIAEQVSIEQIVNTSGLVEFGMKVASQSNPSETAFPGFEKLVEKFEADVDQIRKMRASVWGSSQVQVDRDAFVSLCLGLSDDLGLSVYEVKLARENFPMVLSRHVQVWERSRGLLIKCGNRLHDHVTGELNRLGQMVSQLDARLLIK